MSDSSHVSGSIGLPPEGRLFITTLHHGLWSIYKAWVKYVLIISEAIGYNLITLGTLLDGVTKKTLSSKCGYYCISLPVPRRQRTRKGRFSCIVSVCQCHKSRGVVCLERCLLDDEQLLESAKLDHILVINSRRILKKRHFLDVLLHSKKKNFTKSTWSHILLVEKSFQWPTIRHSLDM